FTRSREEFVKRSPVVSPVEVEADALAQFGFFDFSAPPFVDDVLVPREDGFYAEHERPLANHRILNQRCEITLRTRQRVIISDQDNFRLRDRVANLFVRENFFIRAIGIAKIAEIFTSSSVILSADFALHSDERMTLRRAAPGSEDALCCHIKLEGPY